MRQDQPNLMKQFNTLNRTIRELQHKLALAEAEIDMQDELINDMGETTLDLEQELLVEKIEYNRLFEGKSGLTRNNYY